MVELVRPSASRSRGGADDKHHHIDITHHARHGPGVRTTLDIDPPVLNALRSLAAQTGKSMGQVASALLAKAMQREAADGVRNGLPILAPSGEMGPATMELVNSLRDGDPV